MQPAVITIDFWNTLFDSSGGVARNTARRAALAAAVDEHGRRVGEGSLDDAYAACWGYFDDQWLNHRRTPTSNEMVRVICSGAGVELPEHAIVGVATAFERGVLDDPPQLLPGVAAALASLAARSRLALISDTAFSPGVVLRELMERNGVASYFDAFIFSDETGVAKPHPDAFLLALRALNGIPGEAVHIGDLERTDILGARSVGMRTLLYKGDPHKYAEEETVADGVLYSWDDIADALEALGGS